MFQNVGPMFPDISFSLSRLPPHRSPPIPSFTTPHTLYICPQPLPHPTLSPSLIQSPRQRQGPTYLSLPLTSTHFVLPFPFPCHIASRQTQTCPCWPLSFPHPAQRTCQPRTHRRMLVFNNFRVLHYSCLCLAWLNVFLAFFPPVR